MRRSLTIENTKLLQLELDADIISVPPHPQQRHKDTKTQRHKDKDKDKHTKTKKLSLRAGSPDQKNPGEAQSIISALSQRSQRSQRHKDKDAKTSTQRRRSYLFEKGLLIIKTLVRLNPSKMLILEMKRG